MLCISAFSTQGFEPSVLNSRFYTQLTIYCDIRLQVNKGDRRSGHSTSQYLFTLLGNDMINTLFGSKIYTRIMITVISRNIDKVSGFPNIVIIGYTVHIDPCCV